MVSLLEMAVWCGAEPGVFLDFAISLSAWTSMAMALMVEAAGG